MSVEIENLITRLDTVCKGMEAGLDDWPLASHIWEYRKSIEVIESLRQQLAECQATNGRLRSDMSLFLDSHEECEDFDGFTAQIVGMDDYHKAQEALAVPSDATALNELIAERTKELTAEVERLKAITIPVNIDYGDGAEEVAYGNEHQVRRLKKWLDKYFQIRQQNAELTAQRDGLLAALEEISDDYADRFDLGSQSTNPGIKYVVEQARAAIANCK